MFSLAPLSLSLSLSPFLFVHPYLSRCSCFGFWFKLIKLRAENQTSASPPPPTPPPHLASRPAHIILALSSAFCLVRKTMRGARGLTTRRDARLRPKTETNGRIMIEQNTLCSWSAYSEWTAGGMDGGWMDR